MTQDPNIISIDVHVNKLLEWLMSRHHCTREWPDKIAVVRQKIHTALQDMPEDDALKKILIEASPLNYFHCVKIVDVLKKTEADSKNMFGIYGSRRMKDWQEILKLYQKDNLYLAECASILGRNVIYEIPALKRQATKSEQNQVECLKKEASLKKQSQEFRDKFVHTCAQLGIKFENYDAKKNEGKVPTGEATGAKIVNQMKDKLPDIFHKLSTKSKEVREAVLYYRRFLKNTTKLTDEQLVDCLPVLYTLIEKGNITTYEWKYGEAPVKSEIPEVGYTFETEEAIECDMGEGGEIDFGDDITLETGPIDWGGVELNEPEAEGEIDFSIDTMELDAAGIVLEDTGIEGGVARGEEALSILENITTRKEFVNDLCELEGFLTMRLYETNKDTSSDMMTMLLEFNDDSLRCENMELLLRRTTEILGILKETTTKQYLLVREDKRYVSHVAESLLHNLKLAGRYDRNVEDWSSQRIKLAEEAKQISPRLQSLTKQSRELQTELAKEISSRYNNRPVYITGGVS